MNDLAKRLNEIIVCIKGSTKGVILSTHALNTLEEVESQLKEAAKALTPEPVFYKGQFVITLMNVDSAPKHKIYSHKKDGVHYCFTGYAPYRFGGDVTAVGFVEPDYEAKSLLNWLPNTGVKPDTDMGVLVVYANGKTEYGHAAEFIWTSGGLNTIIKYASIEG